MTSSGCAVYYIDCFLAIKRPILLSKLHELEYEQINLSTEGPKNTTPTLTKLPASLQSQTQYIPHSYSPRVWCLLRSGDVNN